MFTKKKEKKIESIELNPDLILDYNRNFLLKKMKSIYPIGTLFYQKTSYNGLGGIFMIKSEEIEISIEEDNYLNLTFGGVGIWNSKFRKLPKIVKDV